MTQANERRGLFITVEGGDGAGKTTQIKKIAEYFEGKNIPTLTTREPGGTPEAEKIRDLLVKRDGGNWTPEAETLLFFTARHMHVETVIKPALAKGVTVICDRFTDSTRAYQCYGHGLNREFVEQTNRLAINGFSPHLTLILDLPVELGVKRSMQHNAQTQSTEDRFESLDLSFHEKLRQGFLDIAKKNKDRCYVIDASKDMDSVTSDILDVFDKRLGGVDGRNG